MQITEFKQIGKSENYKVLLSEEGSLILSLETIVKNKLKVGSEISKIELGNLQFEGDKSLALEKCVNLLSKSFKTKKEICDYLKQKGYLKEVITYVTEKLLEYKLIDDKAYAERFVESYKNSKGKKYIENMLRLRGIENSIIKNSLENLEQKNVIEEIVKRNIANKEKTEKNKLKLYRFLLSRGFSYDESKKAVDDFLDKE